jgi:hypothetical protein
MLYTLNSCKRVATNRYSCFPDSRTPDNNRPETRKTWQPPVLTCISISWLTANNFNTRVDNQCSGDRGRRGNCFF